MSLDENKDQKNEETAVPVNTAEAGEKADSIKLESDAPAAVESIEKSEQNKETLPDGNAGQVLDSLEAAPEGDVEDDSDDSSESETGVNKQPVFKPGEAVPTVLINYHSAGPMLRCFTNGFDLKINTKVIAERSGGLSLATIKSLPEMYTPTAEEQLPRVVRFIDDRDNLIIEENRRRSAEARRICDKLVEKLNLDMKLIEVEYLHSLNKAIFYFSAEGRVDFRELIRELARSLHIRVEMCQIGVRDEAKLIGGLGPCGLPTCCSAFLSNFAPVSIKMAKEQNLTLNPEKVSGLCGRLICCLSYESQVYRDVQEGLPKIGKKADTWKGRGRVAEIDVFRNKISFDIEEEEDRFICSIDEYREYMQNKETFIPWDERDEDGKQKKKTSPAMKAAEGSRFVRRERSTRPGMEASNGSRRDTPVSENINGNSGNSSEPRDAASGNNEAAPAQGEAEKQPAPDRQDRRNDNYRRRNEGERPREARRDDRQGRPERSDRPDRAGRPEQNQNQNQNQNGAERPRDNRPPRPPRNYERANNERQPGGVPGTQPQPPQSGGRPSDAIRQRPLEPSRPRENGEGGNNTADGNNNNRNRHNRYNRPRNYRPDGGPRPDGNQTPEGGVKPDGGSKPEGGSGEQQ